MDTDNKLNERLTIDRLDDRGCINMLAALLRHMSKEFREAYKSYLIDPTDKRVRMQYKHIRNEFLSSYFMNLTKLDGACIVKELEETVRVSLACCA